MTDTAYRSQDYLLITQFKLMYILLSSESEGDINNKLLLNTVKTKTVSWKKRWAREGVALSYLPTTERTP